MSWFSRRRRDRDVEVEAPAEEEAAPVGPGPHDVADVPDLGSRIDLGALRVPGSAGTQVRLEVEKKTRNAVAVTVAKAGSAMQLQVFAAPRSTGLWDDLRTEIADSIGKQGGTTEELTGRFGTELLARLPVKTPEGGSGHRPARFVGIDGPRWFLRAVLTGKAAVESEAAAELEELLTDVVVVRGAAPHAPRDILVLQAPGKGTQHASADDEKDGKDDGLGLPRRGPEITEVR
ncbi:hypothetical protein GCM10023169_40000 [Georgenia halophila]|uniref:DUF3710 domain-containing protein n=1 Tax=Georgenia halophila TaxID=620889 RepID=A0ABP8LNQ1_9MICO